MTYRGHSVRKTLIRAKFSPQEMTGQRYIYTGCGTGRLISKLNKIIMIMISIMIVECNFWITEIWFFFSFLRSTTVYDILTGEIVYSARGHKDIVRDIAWHPSRCEILTSSWDYNVNLNFFSHGQHRASNFWWWAYTQFRSILKWDLRSKFYVIIVFFTVFLLNYIYWTWI